jgi:hypothetical protein
MKHLIRALPLVFRREKRSKLRAEIAALRHDWEMIGIRTERGV